LPSIPGGMRTSIKATAKGLPLAIASSTAATASRPWLQCMVSNTAPADSLVGADTSPNSSTAMSSNAWFLVAAGSKQCR